MPIQVLVILVQKRKAKMRKRGRGKLLAQVEPEDLIKFGLIPEFIGRLRLLLQH